MVVVLGYFGNRRIAYCDPYWAGGASPKMGHELSKKPGFAKAPQASGCLLHDVASLVVTAFFWLSEHKVRALRMRVSLSVVVDCVRDNPCGLLTQPAPHSDSCAVMHHVDIVVMRR